MAKRTEVSDLLNSFKTAMEFGEYSLANRKKNLQSIVDLGLTPDQAKEIVRELTVDDYSAGPEENHDGATGDVWTFGYDLEAVEVYIKLRLAHVEGKKTVMLAKIISSHKAERAMRHPLRESER